MMRSRATKPSTSTGESVQLILAVCVCVVGVVVEKGEEGTRSTIFRRTVYVPKEVIHGLVQSTR